MRPTRTVMIVLAAIVACAVVVAAAAPAAAQGDAGARVEQRLERGQSLFADLEYARAIEVLSPVPGDRAATRAQRLRALELIGLAHLILGHERAAREAFEGLLDIDPGYQLRDDTGSPKIRDFFDRVKRDYVPGFDAAAELEHGAPESASAGKPVEIEVEVTEGAEVVKEVVARWRRRGVLEYRDAPMRRTDEARWRGRFEPPASDTRYVLEYYVEARDIGGQGVGRVAGPETPLAMPVAPGGRDREPAWYRRWYVLAGGVAVLGAATALFVTSGEQAPDGSLDNVTLSVTRW